MHHQDLQQMKAVNSSLERIAKAMEKLQTTLLVTNTKLEALKPLAIDNHIQGDDL